MMLFFCCVLILIVGYFIYGSFVERVFGIDPERPTPAVAQGDGVDYVELPTWKVFLIQLLDIAGVGPIFGPILGALYGPQALIWIVAGTLLAGGVHDYFSGMLSVRNQGESIPEVIGDELGSGVRWVMRAFSTLLLLLVGVIFVLAPAKLMATLFGGAVPAYITVIFSYYFIATIVPVDKVIGKIYPYMGALLFVMTGALGIALFAGDYPVLANQDFLTNVHPSGKPVWPLLFITLSCGALSGFHSTQSPLMARCLKNEKNGRSVFYGAMVAEGIIALIWTTIGMSFYDSSVDLQTVISEGGPGAVVNGVSTALLGGVGGALAVISVIILPVTSGDTAFRSTRLILSEVFKVSQSKIKNRLLIAVPLFIIGFIISQLDFQIIWRYFGWANQTLATLVLWAGAVHLKHRGKFHWIATLPAVFMTSVVVGFLLFAPIGFGLSFKSSAIAGSVVAFLTLFCFCLFVKPKLTSANES